MSDQQRLLEEDVRASIALRAWLPAFCRPPLRDYALAKLVDLSSHGLVVASSVAATYLLAGGKRGSMCCPTVDGPLPIPYQTLVACLPYIMLPVAVILGAYLKSCLDEGRPVRHIATLTLIQSFVVVILGSWMTMCFTSASSVSVLTGCMSLMCIMTLAWGCTSRRAELFLGVIKRILGRGGGDAGEHYQYHDIDQAR